MDLKVVRQRNASLLAEIVEAKKARAGIGNLAVAENRALSETERAAFTAAGTKITDLEASLAENKELLDAAEAANAAERDFRASSTPDPDAAAGAAALVAAGVKQHRVEVPDKSKQLGFFGRQLQAVRSFFAEGGFAHISGEDRNVLEPMMAAATGMGSDVSSDGGFLVAPDRSTTIMQRMYDTGQILSRVNRIPVSASSNGIQLPAIDETSRADSSRYGGIVSGWLGQGSTFASVAGKPRFRIMDLKLRKVGAFLYATDELLADSVALESWINKYLPLELTFRVENAIVNGTGSNQPLGLLNSGAVITVTRVKASHVTSVDLQAMLARMWAPLRSQAVFLIDQSVETDLAVLSIPIGTAGVPDPLYRPMGSVSGQVYATYAGIPIIPVEHCAALGTSGEIILVALPEYTLIDKGGVEQAVSMHVAFITDEQVFRFVQRVDGQCNWRAALQPKSGGDTLSCIVVLS
jgi:HK97 family phage major capsid protein